MRNGKHICNTLKAIRLDIARANGIAYAPRECHHEGECAGTCPACESEMRYLEREIARRRSNGKAALIAGVSLGLMTLSATSCDQIKRLGGDDVQGELELVVDSCATTDSIVDERIESGEKVDTTDFRKGEVVETFSGGVMAAPVVRDVFADTLLYLGVQPDYTGVDMSTVNIPMPDVRDLTEDEAARVLAEQSLTYETVGSGGTVTGQIPAPNEMLPGNSEVILYMGETVHVDFVTVPDLKGMNPAIARIAMENSGLYLQTKGSSWAYAVVTDQEPAPGTEVVRGSTVTVELTDQTALD